ncbi:MAG: methionine synthase [Pseudomonadota bacterium]
MRLFLLLLALLCTALWVVAYVYLSLLACAFVINPSNSCGVDMPWVHRGEDLAILVIVPGAIVALIWALFFYVRHRDTKRAREK